MRISYTEHVTNDEVLQRVGQGRALMGQVKSRKLELYRRFVSGTAYARLQATAL